MCWTLLKYKLIFRGFPHVHWIESRLDFLEKKDLFTLKPKSRNSVRLRFFNFVSEKGHLFALLRNNSNSMIINSRFYPNSYFMKKLIFIDTSFTFISASSV